MGEGRGPLYVGVIGSSDCDETERTRAFEVGRLIALHRCVLVCGGGPGVMEWACKGAKSAGGVTLGILPGDSRAAANPYVDFSLPTAMGNARNGLIILASDAVIAIGGGPGTLSEIGLALKSKRPIVGLGTWDVSIKGIECKALHRAQCPREALSLALALAGGEDDEKKAGNYFG